MATKFFLAPNARWQGRDQTGAPNVGGKVYTYAAGSVIPKATYQDPAGANPNTNPVILDGKGEANIYWANDNLYYIEEYDVNNNLVFSQDNYPTVDFESPLDPTSLTQINLVRNPQFSYWSNSTDYPNATQSVNNSDYITDDWLFFRSNLNSTVELKQQKFVIGQSVVPHNPLYFFEYICTATGAGGETYKYFGQRFNSVRTLCNQTVSVGFWAKASVPNTALNVTLNQNFGTGGSPSTEQVNPVVTANLTTTWALYSGTATLQAISSSSGVGTNNDDALILEFNLPLNTTVTIDIANVQMQLPSGASSFPFLTLNDQFKHLDNRITNAVWQTGDVKTTFRNVTNQPDPGWLYMDDTTIGSPGSGATHLGLFTKALYELLWNNVLDAYAPVSTGRGVSAEADYNANKTLTLTKTLGRALGCIGLPSSGGTGTTWAAGQTTGAEQHTLTKAELPDPVTNTAFNTVVRNDVGNIAVIKSDGTSGSGTVSNQGGNQPHSIVQPITFLNVMIKL